MLISYIVGANVMGEERFHGQIPSIFLIQDHIENAWDMGINESGRVETGGIKGTRKFIGTPEVSRILWHAHASFFSAILGRFVSFLTSTSYRRKHYLCL
jgi:hypothetical protein